MTRKPSAAALAIIAALLCASSSAQVYKWTDSAGKTHYGDKPPEGVQQKEIKVPTKSYDGPPKIEDWAAILRTRKPGAATPVESLTMYSAVWCGPCKRAKAYMAQRKIPYRDVDIEASEANREEFEAQGGGGVPLFVARGKRMHGFSPDALDRLAGQ